MAHFVIKRGDYFYYFRRVPAHLNTYDQRPHIRISLKTKDPLEAQRKALIHNSAVEKYWNNLVSKKSVHVNDKDWKDAITLVRVYGFSYRLIDDLLNKEPYENIVERLHIIQRTDADKRIVKSLTGLVKRTDLLLSALLDLYFELTKDRLIGKSKDFIRKWENPRKRALANFILAVGDKQLFEINRSDINTFRSWWMEKITTNTMNPGTAGKDVVHLKDIISVVSIYHEIDIDVNVLFSSAKFKNIKSSRAPFEASFVQQKMLKVGALNNLNEEARALVYAMADTGARVNEIIGLLPEDIFLDAEIPFIWIRPNSKRTLKNIPSERQIPLVGSALKGIQMAPQGFPRYKSADSVSNLVNNFLDTNDLKPSSEHTLYSLRHTFKDRLRDIGAPEEVTDELMGHAGHRPRYGRGHTLETKYEWLKKIAFVL